MNGSVTMNVEMIKLALAIILSGRTGGQVKVELKERDNE